MYFDHIHLLLLPLTPPSWMFCESVWGAAIFMGVGPCSWVWLTTGSTSLKKLTLSTTTSGQSSSASSGGSWHSHTGMLIGFILSRQLRLLWVDEYRCPVMSEDTVLPWSSPTTGSCNLSTLWLSFQRCSPGHAGSKLFCSLKTFE